MTRFEARSLEDIRAVGRNTPADDRAFATVARISARNLAAYRRVLQPWVRAVVSQPMADAAKALHPLRLSYTVFASRNPWMAGVETIAAAVAAARRPVAADNPFLAVQTQVSNQIVAGLDAYAKACSQLEEFIFFGVYGSPAVQTMVGLDRGAEARPPPPRSGQGLVTQEPSSKR
jgi:hypothetical protein